MQRVFRVVETRELKPVGPKTTNAFNRSVRRYGVLNPVLLAEVIDADGVIGLAVIDGNRRIRAARSARLPKVPAVVLKATTKEDRARLTLMCNYMRSGNFHTESAAIMALADDEDAAADAARVIGLGPVKMQQLYRKIATMPEPVRQAMREHRIPVSAATWVGAWPEGLQRELVELLDRRRYVNTTMMKDLREWYAERHPEEFAVADPAIADVPLDGWSDDSLRGVAIPAPPHPDLPSKEHDIPRSNIVAAEPGPAPSASLRREFTAKLEPEMNRSNGDDETVPAEADETGGAQASNDPGSMSSLVGDRAGATVAPVVSTTGELSEQLPPHDASPVWATPQPAARQSPVITFAAPGDALAVASVGQVAASTATTSTDGAPERLTPVDDSAERMVAFVVRFDAALREFAREGRELGIGHAVWVDRTMRAWDGLST